jgi:hypothetical protein
MPRLPFAFDQVGRGSKIDFYLKPLGVLQVLQAIWTVSGVESLLPAFYLAKE